MNAPKIQVYCTVREDELEQGPDGLVCTRCIRNLVNLNDPAAAARATGGAPACGFLRRVGGPALASTLLLSSCNAKERQMLMGRIAPPVATQTTTPAPQPQPPPAKPPERPVLPGLIALPQPPPKPRPEPTQPEKSQPAPSAPDKKPAPAPAAPPSREILPGDVCEPKSAENNWPTAHPFPGRPGYVTSPYTGKAVDVVSFETGSLICDPAYPMSAQKYFRLGDSV